MALGTNHGYYKKEDRAIKARLKAHDKRMKELMAEGMDKESASKKAFKEIVKGG